MTNWHKYCSFSHILYDTYLCRRTDKSVTNIILKVVKRTMKIKTYEQTHGILLSSPAWGLGINIAGVSCAFIAGTISIWGQYDRNDKVPGDGYD